MKTRSERRSVFAVWRDTFVLGFKGHALRRVSYTRTLRAKIGLVRVKGNTEMRKVAARGPGYRFTFLSFFAFSTRPIGVLGDLDLVVNIKNNVEFEPHSNHTRKYEYGGFFVDSP